MNVYILCLSNILSLETLNVLASSHVYIRTYPRTCALLSSIRIYVHTVLSGVVVITQHERSSHHLPVAFSYVIHGPIEEPLRDRAPVGRFHTCFYESLDLPSILHLGLCTVNSSSAMSTGVLDSFSGCIDSPDSSPEPSSPCATSVT